MLFFLQRHTGGLIFIAKTADEFSYIIWYISRIKAHKINMYFYSADCYIPVFAIDALTNKKPRV